MITAVDLGISSVKMDNGSMIAAEGQPAPDVKQASSDVFSLVLNGLLNMELSDAEANGESKNYCKPPIINQTEENEFKECMETEEDKSVPECMTGRVFPLFYSSDAVLPQLPEENNTLSNYSSEADAFKTLENNVPVLNAKTTASMQSDADIPEILQNPQLQQKEAIKETDKDGFIALNVQDEPAKQAKPMQSSKTEISTADIKTVLEDVKPHNVKGMPLDRRNEVNTADTNNRETGSIQKLSYSEIQTAKENTVRNSITEVSAEKVNQLQGQKEAEPLKVQNHEENTSAFQNHFTVLKTAGNDTIQGAKFGNTVQSAEEAQVYMQISDKVGEALKEKSTGFKLKLNPEGLGEVTVKLICEGGKVSLDIITGTASTQKLLENQSGELKAALAQKNFELVGMNVGTDTSGASHGRNPFSAFEQGGGWKHGTQQGPYSEYHMLNASLNAEKDRLASNSDYLFGRLNYRI